MNATTDRPVGRLRVEASPSDRLAVHGSDWPAFWQQLRQRLVRDGYRTNTLRVYRQVLRDLRTFLRERHGIRAPDGLTTETADDFLTHLSEKNVSWSWMASSIAVMRNAFDRLSDMPVTVNMVTPRRKWPLPETLSARELRLLFDALPNPRDRLLVALLAGCGLRVSEACRIHWADFDRAAGTLRIEDPSALRSRTFAMPQGLLPLFLGLAAVSRRSDPMICGSRPAGSSKPLSPRQAERIVQTAGRRAGILKRVTPMILRHTYALRRLMAGENIREVQECLGHRSIKTTLRYQACILPKAASPLDPDPPSLAMKQLVTLLDRMNLLVDAMQRPACPRGP